MHAAPLQEEKCNEEVQNSPSCAVGDAENEASAPSSGDKRKAETECDEEPEAKK